MTPPINTRRVMARRHHGWEGASAGLLARIFGVSVQQATAIVAQRCASCGKPICGCSDAAWSGPRIATVVIDDSDPGSWARFFAQRDGTPHTPLTEAELQALVAGRGEGERSVHNGSIGVQNG